MPRYRPPRKTTKQFKAELRARFGKRVRLIGEYPANNHTLADFICTVCKLEFRRTPANMLGGSTKHHCPRCAGRLSHEEYVAVVRAAHGDRLRVLSRYVDLRTPVRYKCECGEVFERNHPLDTPKCKHPCPKCAIEAGRAKYDTSKANSFRLAVDQLTRMNYTRFKEVINPDDLPRSRYEYHLDHVYSIHEAFTNPKGLKRPITVEEVAHPANLVMLPQHENNVKSRFSASTASGLRRNIAAFNRLHRQRKSVSVTLPRNELRR